MSDPEQAGSVQVRLKFDGPESSDGRIRRGQHIDVDEVDALRPFVDCQVSQMSEPLPCDDFPAKVIAILDYGGAPLDTTVTAVRAAVVVEGVVLGGGRAISEPALDVVDRQEVSLGSYSLTVRGEPHQLWRLAHLLHMANNPSAGMSTLHLTGDVQRWAWIHAALDFSGVITPWIELGSSDREFAMTRPIPDEVSVMVEPELFHSRSTFFSLIGERLLGPAGYAGQDLQGFEEVVRIVAHLVQKLDVTFVDSEQCKRVADTHMGGYGLDFFGHVHEIFSLTADMQTLD